MLRNLADGLRGRRWLLGLLGFHLWLLGFHLGLDLGRFLGFVDRSFGLHKPWLGLAGGNGLSCTVHDNPILDQSLQQPMALSGTGDTSIDTGRTQVVVTFVTDAAVVMFPRNRRSTVVAVNTEGCIRRLVEWERQRV